MSRVERRLSDQQVSRRSDDPRRPVWLEATDSLWSELPARSRMRIVSALSSTAICWITCSIDFLPLGIRMARSYSRVLSSPCTNTSVPFSKRGVIWAKPCPKPHTVCHCVLFFHSPLSSFHDLVVATENLVM